ncbi:hypothetical protein CMV_027559 [Castanea mollissima]|uniref:Uncharacterized protein n=1 Tax=Castanea mollissima TaxID=60419 RepID=A0A8J4Q6E4_9ROSI|nr:hypothetical protein CMV_027559 [Castanea mollissima]
MMKTVVRCIKDKLKEIALMEETRWRQKSIALWLEKWYGEEYHCEACRFPQGKIPADTVNHGSGSNGLTNGSWIPSAWKCTCTTANFLCTSHLKERIPWTPINTNGNWWVPILPLQTITVVTWFGVSGNYLVGLGDGNSLMA